MEPSSTSSVTRNQELLDAARAGDEGAFRHIVEAHRRELYVHCYRMLGSLHDAEDALQEVLMRAWRALPRLEGSEWLRAWLYKIATNVCLNAAARRAKRVLPIDNGPPVDPDQDPGGPLAGSVWIEPYPDERLVSRQARLCPKLATSSVRRWSWRSSRRFSIYPLVSAPCWSFAMFSAFRLGR